MQSVTVTDAWQVLVLPESSVTDRVTEFEPRLAQEKLSWLRDKSREVSQASELPLLIW